MLKTHRNPSISWPENLSLDNFRGTWWVAHTKSRNEKALANELAAFNISYFLPMVTKVHSSKGRTHRSLLPLFSGYLFFCGDEQQQIQVLKTNRVANLIKVENQDKLIAELLQFERAINAGAELRACSCIQRGQHCRIIGGVLAGLQGIIMHTKSGTGVVINIDILGKATYTEIDSDMIELIEE